MIPNDALILLVGYRRNLNENDEVLRVKCQQWDMENNVFYSIAEEISDPVHTLLEGIHCQSKLAMCGN